MRNIKSSFIILIVLQIGLFIGCEEDNNTINPGLVLQDQIFYINENSPNNTLVGEIDFQDMDQKKNLQIIAGNYQEAFMLDSLTGKIYVKNSSALDYEVWPKFELAIISSDNNNNILHCFKITIILNDITIPTIGLVAYYPFNNNANDESNNNYNGIVYGATLCSDRYNQFNKAFAFDGYNDYIDTYSSFDYQNRTVSFWAYFNNINDWQVVLVQDSYELNYGLLGATLNQGILTLHAGGAGSESYFTTNKIQTNTWYHIVLVRDGSETNYYIDGELVGSGLSNTIGSTLYPNSNFIIGTSRRISYYLFNGMIDDVAIYNRALNAEEINNLLFGE